MLPFVGHRVRTAVAIAVIAGAASWVADRGRQSTPPLQSEPYVKASNPGVAAPALPLPAAKPNGIALIRAFSTAPRETIRLSPPDAPAAEPTARYASLTAARDTIEAILLRSIRLGDPAIRVTREAVQFRYLYARATTVGWAIHVAVTDTSACPNEPLQDGLLSAGWAPDYGYGADGPDGQHMGFVTRDLLCVVEARWDGGDDSDTTYVPAPGCEVTATCVPRRADDTPER